MNMDDQTILLYNELEQYIPFNEQEEQDRLLIQKLLREEADIFGRSNTAHHMTASAWVVSPDRKQVLMAYHNIYDSWSWLGGHADGEKDLKKVACREVEEESGLSHVRLLSDSIFSLEVLTVDGHIKNNRYVSSHLHLNITYLIEADPAENIHIKPDENSRIGWFEKDKAVEASTEPWFREHIYTKLNAKLAEFKD